MAHYVPYVTDSDGRGERTTDIYSRLLRDRIVFIGSEINDIVANTVIAQLLFLNKEGPTKDIEIYINSPGGSITAGLAIYDTMQFLQCPVNTYCIGLAASMGALLLAAGTPGKRFALPNSRVMFHQPHGGVTGTAEDIIGQAREINTLKGVCAEILSLCTGQTLEKIRADSERDYWLSALQAKDYGFIDQVTPARTKKEKSA